MHHHCSFLFTLSRLLFHWSLPNPHQYTFRISLPSSSRRHPSTFHCGAIFSIIIMASMAMGPWRFHHVALSNWGTGYSATMPCFPFRTALSPQEEWPGVLWPLSNRHSSLHKWHLHSDLHMPGFTFCFLMSGCVISDQLFRVGLCGGALDSNAWVQIPTLPLTKLFDFGQII